MNPKANKCRLEFHCFHTPSDPCVYRKAESYGCKYGKGMHCQSSVAQVNAMVNEAKKQGAIVDVDDQKN